MIGAEIIFNEKESVTIGTYNFAYIFVSCGSKTGDWMVAAGSSFKERYTKQTSQPLITQQSDRKKMKARYEQLKDELKEKGLIK